MKRAFLTCLLVALLPAVLSQHLAAQTNNAPALLTFGPWAACEAGMFPPDSFYCLGVTPGSETYQLLIPNEGSLGIIAYHYNVTATLKTGEVRTLTGVVERAVDPAPYTFTILNFGGPLKDYSFTIQNLGVVSLKTRLSRAN